MGAVKGESLKLNIVATAAVPRKRFVSPTGGLPTANGNSIGVSDMAAAIGEAMVVDYSGLSMVEAGAALPTLGAFLSSDAQGRAVAWSAGAVRVAYLAPMVGNTATAAGQFVSVIVIPNNAPTA